MSGWETRAQPEIQMGNGTLLATFDAQGEIDQLFAPNLDALQSRLGAYRTSVLVPPAGDQGNPEIIAITPDQFDIRLQMSTGSQVLQAEYHHKYRPMKLQRKLGLHPTEPVILDQWKVSDERVGLLHESIPWIGHVTSAHCSMYHPSFNALVHHRGRRWFGVVVRGQTQTHWVRVGHLADHDRYRMWSGEKIAAPVNSGDLAGYPAGAIRQDWDQVVQGCSTWGALAVAPGENLEFVIICADSEKHLGRLLEQMSHVPTRRYFQMIESTTVQRHLPAQPVLERIKNPRVRALTERSIDVLHALQDAQTGALMAAAEVDPHSRLSGGYGYSWPRDGAYLGNALGAFNFHDRVEKYLGFLTETQDPTGTWWQRYLATGQAGPSWGRIQIDEPATVIGLAYFHFRRTQNLLWLEQFWPTIEKGLDFLKSFHSAEHPIGMPSHDLWEERMGIHAYSLAAVSSAFLAGAYLAGELSEPKAQAHYHEWSRSISKLLVEKFLPETGQIRRSFIANAWDYNRGGGYWDEAADVSMLGLIRPFGVLKKNDPAAHKIIESVRHRLWSRPVGGVIRYEGDTYRGGNPWILNTLWLGMIDVSLGNYTEARECFQWAMSKSTSLGMLPEQVHRESGKPYWIIPLGWSHAMFLLFVRQVLDKKIEAQIWENL